MPVCWEGGARLRRTDLEREEELLSDREVVGVPRGRVEVVGALDQLWAEGVVVPELEGVRR